MLHGDQYGKITRRAGSRAQLRKVVGEGSNLGMLLYPYLWQDVVFLFEDFFGGTLDTRLWTATADATATAFAPSGDLAGVVRGATGTTAGGFTSLKGGYSWNGQTYAGLEARLKLNPATGLVLETGFVDSITDATLPAVTDVDTPTIGNGAFTAALLHIDMSQTLTTMAAITGSSVGDPKGSVVLPAAPGGSGGYTPTANIPLILRMQLAGSSWSAAVYHEAALVSSAAQANPLAVIPAADFLLPWLIVGTRNTTSKFAYLDYLALWCDRS